MRTEVGPEIGLCPILVRTESLKFGQRSDPFWVHKWPVGSKVRSHLRTFVAVDQSLQNFIYHPSHLMIYLPGPDLSVGVSFVALDDDSPFRIVQFIPGCFCVVLCDQRSSDSERNPLSLIARRSAKNCCDQQCRL
ncbi:hypothetical protein BYT27DRAFT_6843368 [Phlegmacium glaucopus]|nr:hypothetical protein BYT27DRAFT_6843368 [Phlegmacium glaucopus]